LSECIAVYDRCNGIAQCRDESDEFQCNDQQQSPQSSENSRQLPEKPAGDQEVPKIIDGTSVHRGQAVFSNTTNNEKAKMVSAGMADRKIFLTENADAAGVYARGNADGQPLSQVSDRFTGNSQLLSRNGYGSSFAGFGRGTSKSNEQLDSSEPRISGGFRKPVSQADKYPVYQSRPIDQSSQKAGGSEDVAQVGRASSGQAFEHDRAKASGLFLSDQPDKGIDSLMSKPKAKAVDQSIEKQEQSEIDKTKFASSRGNLGMEIDSSSVNYEDSRGSESLTDMDRLKNARTAKLTGETGSNGQLKNDGRYQLKGLPSQVVSAKADDRAAGVGELSHGGYPASGGSSEKQTDRYLDKSSVEDPAATSDDDESHRYGILHRESLDSRFADRHLSRNKEQKHVPPNSVSDGALSSDFQYGKLRNPSVTESLAGSKFPNAKMRNSDSKSTDDLQEGSKSVVHNADQSQWVAGDKFQRTGSPDYGSEHFRPYVDVEGKSSREKDNVKTSKLHGAELPSQSDLSDTVLKSRIRPLQQAPVEDPTAYGGQDKELAHYQDNGDLLMHGKAGRLRPLDRNERPADLSLDHYSANVAGGGDRSGQVYGYGNHYNDEDAVGNRYIDGQTDSASPYDGVHLPADGTGQAVSRGQFYGYGHDAYGDNSYNSDDYYYGMMARPSSRGYGHAVGSVPDYDYYNANDGGTRLLYLYAVDAKHFKLKR
jgi:hypothetical protein